MVLLAHFEFGAGRRYDLCENKDNQFVTFSSDRVQAIKFPTYEDARIRSIEFKTKFSDNEKLKATALTSKCGIFIELDCAYSEDRKIIKELMSKHYCHQLVHNFSASEINDGAHSVARKKSFVATLRFTFLLIQF